MKQGTLYNIIILAAGASTRLGSPKQLLKYNNANLVQHAVDVAVATDAQQVILVLGADSDIIRRNLNEKEAVVITNEEWQEGMASSIKLGIDEILRSSSSIDAAILMVCDQPYVTAALLRSLVTQHENTGRSVVASHYNDTLGTPVFFHKSFFPQLAELKGDTGAKKIIMDNLEQVQPVEFTLGDIDIDNKSDYEKLVQKNSGV